MRSISITTSLLSSPLLFSFITLAGFNSSRTFFPFNKVNSVENTSLRPFSSKMAWYCSAGSNEGLVNNLKAAKIIKSEKVEKAMKAVDRKHYVSQSPYKDTPQPLGFGATISAP